MTARRLERRPAGHAVHLPRARRTARLPAAFWPLLGLNTLLQLAAVLGRPDWLRWGLQLPVAVALVVVVGRYLMRWRAVRWQAVR